MEVSHDPSVEQAPEEVETYHNIQGKVIVVMMKTAPVHKQGTPRII